LHLTLFRFSTCFVLPLAYSSLVVRCFGGALFLVARCFGLLHKPGPKQGPGAFFDFPEEN
jgi:hypothetical protein